MRLHHKVDVFTDLILDIQFSLKLWWALWCISKEKKTKSKFTDGEITSNLKEIFKPCPDNPRIIMDENSCDSVLFYGADQQGNSLFVKMNHRGYRITESALQVTLSDGRVYVLPDYPHTVVMDGTGQKWSASGLKIELLEPRRRWRITYNGLLRNQCFDDALSDDNVEHIRLNFIFIGNSSFEWPGDWSTRLHAAALAHEPWKGPDWMHKIKLLDYTGFDQWGSAIGQVTFKDSTASALYLRGFCQRRWGKHEFDQFHRTVTFLGVAASGAMYCLGVSRSKNSFSHMRFGHVNNTNETQSKVDWTDLTMEDFEKQGDYVPANYRIKFRANAVEYDAVINHTGSEAINYYNGQPWRWAVSIRNLHIKLNGSKGAGLMIVCYPHRTGPNEMKVPTARIQHLKRPETLMHRDNFVLHFADKQCQNESVVGGKGCSLAILTSIKTDDFVIPRGFCVTNFALERQLEHDKQLRDMITDIVDVGCTIGRNKKEEDLKNCCEKTVSVVQNTPVEEHVKQAILDALKKLESYDEMNGGETNTANNRYAVRSSAIGEDSEETSAAGQNSTYLGVHTADGVIESVAKCWASLYSYQSVEYRRQNGLPLKACMGVCVQKMVNAEAAGVMFTRHPTTGDPSSIIITANYGLGETVVSGTVEPDTLTIRRKWDNTLAVSATVLGSKEHKISLSDDGVMMNNLSEGETRKISISDAIALRVAEIGLHLESFFGSARDVEWAVVDEQIYLLQARPITTINAWTDFELTHELDSGVPADVDLMTFANVGEVLPRPVCPLSITTILRVLNMSVGLKSFDIAVCGQVVTTPEVHMTAVRKLGVAGIKQVVHEIINMFKWAWINERIVKEATKVYHKYELNANEFQTAHELYNVINKKYAEIFLLGMYHTHTSRVSVCYQMLAMSLLTAKSNDITPEHIADIAVLLSSCTNVIGTEVPIALSKIAVCIRRCGKAKDFVKVEPANATDWLKSNCPAAAEELLAFYDMHGHRCVQEMDFISEPWILEPDTIISTIQSLVTSIEENYVCKTLSVQETIASLKTPMPSVTKWFLQKVIPLSRKAVTRREMTKNFAVFAIHKMRMAYRRLGILMVKENYIPDENLIFFLTNYEIARLLNSHHNPLIVRKALRRRKIYHQASKVEYPEFCTGMPMPIQTFDIALYKNSTKVEGTAVCGGSIMARACVITDLSEAKSIQHGDILITHCTDIGWSPYFPLLGGIVTELGGLISHGAVVAREYGLPCIVGAKHATQVFQTGN
ncbi:Probable phosphoenolpyruvate synthase [Harpegnathos saltator]|uniref:Probable phosphoenolpyruvate synthase n=1 Tax=Harpegnathos saltator TaxID=610380 RepID=E2BY46_HARSA|nr:Probable phosphoenolpyruvate synthase [Harpegnathos saltator]